MLKTIILNRICSHFCLDIDTITLSSNLFKNEIDSLDFLEYARLVESIAKEQGLEFDIKDFLYSESYSIDDIAIYLEQLNLYGTKS